MTATAARASAGAAEARPGRTPSGVRCTELCTRAAGPGLPHGVGHRGHSPGRGAADRGRRPRWTGSPRRPGAAGRVPRADPAPQRAGGDAPQRRGRTGAQGERRGEDPAVHRRVTARRAARAAALRGGRRSRRRASSSGSRVLPNTGHGAASAAHHSDTSATARSVARLFTRHLRGRGSMWRSSKHRPGGGTWRRAAAPRRECPRGSRANRGWERSPATPPGTVAGNDPPRHRRPDRG